MKNKNGCFNSCWNCWILSLLRELKGKKVSSEQFFELLRLRALEVEVAHNNQLKFEKECEAELAHDDLMSRG